MNPEISNKEKEHKIRKEKLAKAIYDVKNEYNKKNQGDTLKIVGTIINAVSAATVAQITKKGVPALTLSLQIALHGIEKDSSTAGVIGPKLSKAIRGISERIVQTFLKKEDIGSQVLFKLVVQAFVLVTVFIAWKIEGLNLSKNDEKLEPIEAERVRLFGLELILILILKTEAIERIIKSISITCGANDLQQMMISRLLRALVLVLMLIALTNGKEESLKILAIDLREDLIIGLNDIQNFLNYDHEEGVQTPALNIFIQQAIASLEDENFETVFQAYAGVLNEIEATPKMIDDELTEIKKFAEVIYNAFTQGSEDLARMTTSHMV